MEKTFNRNLNRNIDQLLMPIVNIMKRNEDITLFNRILKLCSEHKLNELVLPLSSTASGWKDEEARNQALVAINQLLIHFPDLHDKVTPPANPVPVQIET